MCSENSDTKDGAEISASSQRFSFQKEAYVKRCEKEGKDPSQDYLDLFDRMLEDREHKFDDLSSRKNSMEYDLLTTDWILRKVRATKSYAQNLYAAMCNMRFVRKEMFPYLRQDPDKDLWSASWRSAGGIIADMRQEGDYIDWYCSGMGGLNGSYDSESEDFDAWQHRTRYVAESIVTEEIQQDFLRLGWIPVPWDDDSL